MSRASTSQHVLDELDQWTKEDHKKAITLIGKACRLGVWEKVYQDAISQRSADELFELVDGSMNDSSKRLRESPTHETKPNSSSYAPVVAPSQMATPLPSAAMPLMPTGTTPFPEGVTSMSQWGSSLVAFGKFKDLKTCEEVRTETNDEVMSYKKYMYSHRRTCSGAMKDLINYLNAHSSDWHVKPNVTVIPGTNVARAFRSP